MYFLLVLEILECWGLGQTDGWVPNKWLFDKVIASLIILRWSEPSFMNLLQIQQLTDDFTDKVDEMLKAKTNELTQETWTSNTIIMFVHNFTTCTCINKTHNY